MTPKVFYIVLYPQGRSISDDSWLKQKFDSMLTVVLRKQDVEVEFLGKVAFPGPLPEKRSSRVAPGVQQIAEEVCLKAGIPVDSPNYQICYEVYEELLSNEKTGLILIRQWR